MPRYSHKLFSAGFTFLLCVCSSYAISSYILLRTSHMFSPVNRGHHENLGNVRNAVAMKPQTAQRHYGTSFPLFSVRRTRSAVSSLRTDEKNNGDTDGGYPLRTGSDIVRQSFSRSDGKVCLIFSWVFAHEILTYLNRIFCRPVLLFHFHQPRQLAFLSCALQCS